LLTEFSQDFFGGEAIEAFYNGGNWKRENRKGKSKSESGDGGDKSA
jgi:hypothetical protein